MIGIFPNEESLVKTMGAVLIEESHNKESGRGLCSSKIFKEFMTPEVKKHCSELRTDSNMWLLPKRASLIPFRKVIYPIFRILLDAILSVWRF